MFELNGDLLDAVIHDFENELKKWNAALLKIQTWFAEMEETSLQPNYSIKENCCVRFVNLQAINGKKPPFPDNNQIGQFLEVEGIVVCTSQAKLLEVKRDYVCTRCFNVETIEADYIQMYTFESPKECSILYCPGTMHRKSEELVAHNCIDYQEIKIDEPAGNSNLPKSLVITLESDLVLMCQPGDSVVVW